MFALAYMQRVGRHMRVRGPRNGLSVPGPGGTDGDDHATRAAIQGTAAVMRRPAHGATRRPPLARPGNGFGRPVRPGPPTELRDARALAVFASWDPIQLLFVNLTNDDQSVNA